MFVRFVLFFLGCIFFASSVVQAAVHVIQKGETLASIARAYYGEPVFGPKGNLNRIYKLNPWAKANPSLVEPGQKITLEDNLKARAVISVPVVTPVAEELSAEEKELTPPVVVTKPVIIPESTATEHVQQAERGPNYFFIIPSFSQITQAAHNDAAGVNYTLNSSSAYGAEFGWDHWWSESFSTVISYSVVQIKTTATSDLTGLAVLDSTMLGHGELLLMNRVLPMLRIGLGLNYGDHLFLEDFSSTPADQKIYKTAFWNSLLAAEITAYENHNYEAGISLKASALPAQVGQGHDLRSGLEYFAQFTLLQKFDSWAMSYGVSYSTENQTRTDSTETRTETALHIGALF